MTRIVTVILVRVRRQGSFIPNTQSSSPTRSARGAEDSLQGQPCVGLIGEIRTVQTPVQTSSREHRYLQAGSNPVCASPSHRTRFPVTDAGQLCKGFVAFSKKVRKDERVSPHCADAAGSWSSCLRRSGCRSRPGLRARERRRDSHDRGNDHDDDHHDDHDHAVLRAARDLLTPCELCGRRRGRRGAALPLGRRARHPRLRPRPVRLPGLGVRGRLRLVECERLRLPSARALTLGSVSLFGGAITASSVQATYGKGTVAGLEIDGTAVSASAGQTVGVESWGQLKLGETFGRLTAPLVLRLLQAHGSLPAGTRIAVAFAAARRPLPSRRRSTTRLRRTHSTAGVPKSPGTPSARARRRSTGIGCRSLRGRRPTSPRRATRSGPTAGSPRPCRTTRSSRARCSTWASRTSGAARAPRPASTARASSCTCSRTSASLCRTTRRRSGTPPTASGSGRTTPAGRSRLLRRLRRHAQVARARRDLHP